MTYKPPVNYFSYKTDISAETEKLQAYEDNNIVISKNDISRSITGYDYDILYTEIAWPYGLSKFAEKAGAEAITFTEYCLGVKRSAQKAEYFYIVSSKRLQKILGEHKLHKILLHKETAYLFTNDPRVSLLENQDIYEVRNIICGLNKNKTLYDPCAGFGGIIPNCIENNIFCILEDINEQALFIAKNNYENILKR